MSEAKSIALEGLLDLVGTLDDSTGEDTPRERFRRYLQRTVTDLGILRDYAETCLRKSGSQYNRALQDIVNRLGELLEFEVTYGRYAGTSKHIGFDGHWISPLGHHIVVEVKTTDAYSIKTATLLNYINELVSEGDIPQDTRCLGLYVVGRPDAELKQLEGAIIAEKRLQELRIISVDSLISLTELVRTYDVHHESLVALLLPAGPHLDVTVDLMARLVAQAQIQGREVREPEGTERKTVETGECSYYMSPVEWKEFNSPMEAVGGLLRAGKYAFGERTPHRRDITPGDWICFYASAMGVFAHAQVASAPTKQPLPDLTHDPDAYPWTFELERPTVYEEQPIPITADTRAQLEAFADLDVSKNWGWFVTGTSRISEHDFKVLTGQIDLEVASE